MHPPQAFLATIGIVVAAKTLAWLVQLKTRNAGLVDPIWAWTLGGLAVFYAAVGTSTGPARILLTLMGGAWGLRLGTHLWRRNWGKPEDWRYAGFREKWGAGADAKMFWFFQFQNIFTLLLAGSAFLPVAYEIQTPALPYLVLAPAIWLVAVLGEGVADAQMERFRANPANQGQVCRDGLWRYSRHPNYFFECVHWLAYVPLAATSPYLALTLVAPVVMAFLLLKLSGVPMLEAGMAQRKPGYAEYMRTTSALIPLPPKK
jgi:steroid 5-alpha reductase family enzyme